MVQAAVADVIGPTVTTEDPHGLLGEQVVHIPNLLEQFMFRSVGQRGKDFFTELLAPCYHYS